jgi:hypothetical protein
MSNYIKSTDFSVKDGLTTGDPDKRIKGVEIDDEFDALATAIATKADLFSPELLGTPTAPTASQAISNNQLATTSFAKTAASSAITDYNTALSVTTSQITTGAVTTDKIADLSVTTAKLANSNVTTAKIADSNVTTAKIADSNVTTAKIADANITKAKLASSVKFIPDVVLTRRASGNQSMSVGNWVTIGLDTKDVDNLSVAFSSSAVTLPAGTYYFESVCPVRCTGSDSIQTAYTALRTTGGTEIAKGSVQDIGDWSTSSFNAVGTFTLASSTAIVLEFFQNDSPTGVIDGVSGYVSAYLKLWKTA